MKAQVGFAILFVFALSGCTKKEEKSDTSSDTSTIVTDPGNGQQGSETGWLVGATVPEASVGKNGEFFLHSLTGDLYRKILNKWTIVMNLKGPPGATGANGAAGPQGLQGPAGTQGPAGPAGLNGAKGDKGEKGDRGEVGATGATGPMGATGAAGPRGPAGDKGANGDPGLDANRVLLTARLGLASTPWSVTKRLIAALPTSIEVTYGTIGNGALVVDLGAKVRCVYRGEGVTLDPRYGTYDFERGRLASIEKCVEPTQVSESDIANNTDKYKKLPGLEVTKGVELFPSDQMLMKILSGGTKIPGPKALATFVVQVVM